MHLYEKYLVFTQLKNEGPLMGFQYLASLRGKQNIIQTPNQIICCVGRGLRFQLGCGCSSEIDERNQHQLSITNLCNWNGKQS